MSGDVTNGDVAIAYFIFIFGGPSVLAGAIALGEEGVLVGTFLGLVLSYAYAVYMSQRRSR